MSDKAKVIYQALKELDDYSTSYDILETTKDINFWEKEELQDLADPQDIKETLNIKGINTIVASLVRKGLVEKTLPTTITTKDNKTRNLRKYKIKEN